MTHRVRTGRSATTPATGRRSWALPLGGGLALSLALGLAGCSSSSTASSTTTSTTAATTTSTTGAATTSTTTTTAATTTTCQPSQLSASPQTGSGGAGTIELTINFTNTSTTTCTLGGYPGMQMLTSTGASIPTNVVRGGGQPFSATAANQPPTTVTLAPNGVAAFSLNYEDVPVGNETTCPTSAKAEITPPNDLGNLVVPVQLSPCGGGTIHVSPVYALS